MKTLITGLALFLATSSWAGTETHGTGGGGDAHNPWNLGDTPVDYCVEIEEGTPYDAKDLHRITEESFQDWKTFFTTYGFHKMYIGTGEGDLYFKDRQKKRLTLDFKYVPKCTDLKTQIRILFREQPESVPAWESPSGNALGAATRGDYNHETFRNGGTVWVYNYKNSIDILSNNITPAQVEEARNNKRKSRRGLGEVKHVLLHELGHVFGMKHNEVWVMYERAAEAMLFEGMGWGRWDDFGKIELPTWKYHYSKGDQIPFERNFISGMKRTADRAKDQEEYDALNKAMAAELDIKSLNRDSVLFVDETLPDGRRKIALQLKESFREEPESPKFHGFLDAVNRGWDVHKGPVLYTTWDYVSQGEASPSAQPIGFDDIPSEFPATGHLEWKDKVFPITIEYRYGPLVKVFFPGTKRWQVIYGTPIRSGLRNELDF
ncbi:hypothetical protein K2X33_06055 [bacterium]|nr:hypothetical protein [bacterium]